MELQELIARGRFIFSGAPKRFEVFKLVNGKRSTKNITIKLGRGLTATLKDIKKMKDMELITPKIDKNGKIIKKEGCTVYAKVPLIRHVPLSYFLDATTGSRKVVKIHVSKKVKKTTLAPMTIPSENQILDICKHGEDQLYEFKAPGVKISKVAKEIAAFLHNKNGGLIFYGVDDDGYIMGSDMRRQKFDQAIQNSIRNTIYPQPNVEVEERNVLGHKIIIIAIPPWNRKNIYQYTKERRVYIRKGTNNFVATPEELKKLGRGEYVI